jgi:hypothetical protein
VGEFVSFCGRKRNEIREFLGAAHTKSKYKFFFKPSAQNLLKSLETKTKVELQEESRILQRNYKHYNIRQGKHIFLNQCTLANIKSQVVKFLEGFKFMRDK